MSFVAYKLLQFAELQNIRTKTFSLQKHSSPSYMLCVILLLLGIELVFIRQ